MMSLDRGTIRTRQSWTRVHLLLCRVQSKPHNLVPRFVRWPKLLCVLVLHTFPKFRKPRFDGEDSPRISVPHHLLPLGHRCNHVLSDRGRVQRRKVRVRPAIHSDRKPQLQELTPSIMQLCRARYAPVPTVAVKHCNRQVCGVASKRQAEQRHLHSREQEQKQKKRWVPQQLCQILPCESVGRSGKGGPL
jgi:hypothetical protein